MAGSSLTGGACDLPTGNVAPAGTAPVPAPKRTAPKRTAPKRTAPKRTAPAPGLTRADQARTIVQARWSLVEPPPADDIEVGWLLARGEPLTERYARAVAELEADLEARLA